MKLLAEHLPALAQELTEICAGMEVKDIAGLPPRDILLVFDAEDREGPAVRRVRLSASRTTPRLHLQHGRTFRHTGPIGPFAQGLQQDLIGATLKAVRPVRGDRIVILEFKDSPTGEPRALLLELFGPHSNMYLLGREDRVLAHLIEPPTPRGDKAPRIILGEPWTAPPGGAGKKDAPEFSDSFPAPNAEAPQAGAPLSWAVEALLEPIAESTRIEDERKRVRSRLSRKMQSAKTRHKGLLSRKEATQTMDRVRQDGELLKAALGQWKRGAKSIELQDWFEPDAPQRKITLDPKLDPQANVKRIFTRYKKLQRSAEHVDTEIAEQEERMQALERFVTEIEESTEPENVEERAIAAGLLDAPQVSDQRKKKEPKKRLPYRTFSAHDGTEIRVGRSARDNDDLTFRHARGSDLWLHTADAPGSHVILRGQRNQEADSEAIIDAAILAVHFSPLKNAGKANVHVVHQKRVQKPKGAKPGLVTLSGGKVLYVRMEAKRLDRLLRSQGS